MANDLPQITIDWINRKWINKHCPFCNGKDFAVTEGVYEMPEYSKEIKVAKQVVPVVIVVCKTCGVVFPINAVIMEKEIEGIS